MNELQKMFIERAPDAIADDLLVSAVNVAMDAKLQAKRDEGRGGWHGASCSNEKLKRMLIEHIEKGDMIDVINIAGMMYMRSKLFGDDA